MAFQPVKRSVSPAKYPNRTGEMHYRATLSVWDIAAIRRRCDEGESYASIASAYEVSRSHVRRIHRKERRVDG